MDNNGLTASYIYTNTSFLQDDIIEEKISMLALYISLFYKMNINFYDNESLKKSLEYISLNFNIIFNELDFEHNVYLDILNYLSNVDNLDDIPLEILQRLDYVLNVFEETLEERVNKFSCIIYYYENLIQNNNLNKITAASPIYKESLTEEKKEVIRKLIPGE